MSNGEHLRNLKPLTGVAYGIAAAGVLTVAAISVIFAVPHRAEALPSYAQQTGLACGRCHVNPAGGGPRTAFGNAFAANGHKVPSASKTAKPAAAGGAKTATPSPAVVAAPPPPPPLSYPAVTANPGSYYSSAVNPYFGYVPELSYSNSVDTRIYPFGNR